MAKFTKPNHTQVPNSLMDSVMWSLTGAQLKVFLAICRKTIGWHKEIERIPYSQFEQMTGLSINGIKTAIGGLLAAGLVVRTGGSQHFKYEVNFADAGTMSVTDTVRSATMSKSDIGPIRELHSTVSESDTEPYHSVIPQKKEENKETLKSADEGTASGAVPRGSDQATELFASVKEKVRREGAASV